VKKRYLVVSASALAVAVLIGGSRLRAQADIKSQGNPLKNLARGFAGEFAATTSLCLNDTFTDVQDCSITPATQVVPFHNDATTQDTFDTKGNACVELIQISSSVPAGPGPADISNGILVLTTTSYDSSTGSGYLGFTEYEAGPGVKCNGSTLVGHLW
jgi:hypothetical protein